MLISLFLIGLITFYNIALRREYRNYVLKHNYKKPLGEWARTTRKPFSFPKIYTREWLIIAIIFPTILIIQMKIWDCKAQVLDMLANILN